MGKYHKIHFRRYYNYALKKDKLRKLICPSDLPYEDVRDEFKWAMKSYMANIKNIPSSQWTKGTRVAQHVISKVETKLARKRLLNAGKLDTTEVDLLMDCESLDNGCFVLVDTTSETDELRIEIEDAIKEFRILSSKKDSELDRKHVTLLDYIKVFVPKEGLVTNQVIKDWTEFKKGFVVNPYGEKGEEKLDVKDITMLFSNYVKEFVSAGEVATRKTYEDYRKYIETYRTGFVEHFPEEIDEAVKQTIAEKADKADLDALFADETPPLNAHIGNLKEENDSYIRRTFPELFEEEDSERLIAKRDKLASIIDSVTQNALSNKFGKPVPTFDEAMNAFYRNEWVERSASVEPKESVKIIPELDDEAFLMGYLNTHSPSGFEGDAQFYWRDSLRRYANITETDLHGNVTGVIHAQPDVLKNISLQSPKRTIMIEAHSDEISYIVTKINANGTISVMRNGGSDESIAPSKRVYIHTENEGYITAVFGWTAIHIRDKNTVANTQSIYLDAGFDTKEDVLSSGIKVGDLVTYTDEPEILNDKIIGKSLDNKIGGYVIMQVAKRIKEEGGLANYHLVIANSVQEEVGLKGARMLAENVKPDIVIVTDVTHDSTQPNILDKNLSEIKLGKGPVLVKGAAINPTLLNLAKNVGVPYQLAAHTGRGTGTDADVFSYANGGIPTLLIKMPQKYMHTTVEMCSISDINGAIELMYQTLVAIDESNSREIFNPNQSS